MGANISSRRVLYLSYDGLTDGLGQSQILPYVLGLSDRGFDFEIVSAEKPEIKLREEAAVQNLLMGRSIHWHSIQFHRKPKWISKFWDLRALNNLAHKVVEKENIKLIHCRSYVGMPAAIALKRKFGIPILFDMRGFWVDERVDANLWDLNNPAYRLLFKHWKAKEAEFISFADAIISLTHSGKREIERWKAYRGQPIEVIPCAADFELFCQNSEEKMRAVRIELSISESSFVVTYLGSLGGWYLTDEMLKFFSILQSVKNDAVFLFITPDLPEEIICKASKFGIDQKHLRIVRAPRARVPEYLSLSHINLSFIKPAYSKKASSPTKLGEVLALGIPVICNAGVGDVDEIVSELNAGLILSDFSDEQLHRVANQALHLKVSADLRLKARRYFDLSNAIDKYEKIYRSESYT